MYYYDKKYPYLHYPFLDNDGTAWFMYSIPVTELIKIYKSYLQKIPKSFFDCGAAVGELVYQADMLGLEATGIDIKKYPIETYKLGLKYIKYFETGKIQIKSILDYQQPITADIAYCNGTLTYLTEKTLPLALAKFKHVGMLIAIHNTIEDVIAARQMDDELLHHEPRLIKSNQWWLNTFKKKWV